MCHGDNYKCIFYFNFFPEFISGHLVVISEDLFGVLFLELHSFSVYQRVEENLEAILFKQISRTNWNLQTFPGCTLNPWYRTWLCPPKQGCCKTCKYFEDVNQTNAKGNSYSRSVDCRLSIGSWRLSIFPIVSFYSIVDRRCSINRCRLFHDYNRPCM